MAGATEVWAFQVTCPPGVVPSAPQITQLAMPVRTVHRVEVQVPPGPNGLMGFSIGSTGESIIPIVQGTFIVASERVLSWDVADQIESGSWQAIMYNNGVFPHTIYITFEVELPDAPAAGDGVAPVVIAPVSATPVTTPVVTTSPLPPVPVLTP